MHNMVTLNRTRIELTREVAAVEIPAGTEATLADGALVQLVHAYLSCILRRPWTKWSLQNGPKAQ